jgi:hypothetical protein
MRRGTVYPALPSLATKSGTEYLIQQTGIETSRAMHTATCTAGISMVSYLT